MAELESSLTDIGWLNQKLMTTQRFGRWRTAGDRHSPTGTTAAAAGLGRPTTTPNNQAPGRTPTKIPWSPPTPRQRPVLSYASLIVQAIKSTSDRRMTLGEIYDWMAGTYPYFGRTGNGWKNSVRHNLSLNKCFVKISRSKDDRGKGSYWTIDESHLNENGRPKTRPRPRPRPRLSSAVSTRGNRRTCHDVLRGSRHGTKGAPCSILPPLESAYERCEVQEETTQGTIGTSHDDDETDRSALAGDRSSDDTHHTTETDVSAAAAAAAAAPAAEIPVDDCHGLGDSFDKLLSIAFEDSDDRAFSSSDCSMGSLEGHARPDHGHADLDDIDLSGFPDLAESMKCSDFGDYWLLSTGRSPGVARAEEQPADDFCQPFFTPPDTVDRILKTTSSLPTDEERSTQGIVSSGIFCGDEGDDEIEDDFNWESLLLT